MTFYMKASSVPTKKSTWHVQHTQTHRDCWGWIVCFVCSSSMLVWVLTGNQKPWLLCVTYNYGYVSNVLMSSWWQIFHDGSCVLVLPVLCLHVKWCSTGPYALLWWCESPLQRFLDIWCEEAVQAMLYTCLCSVICETLTSQLYTHILPFDQSHSFLWQWQYCLVQIKISDAPVFIFRSWYKFINRANTQN